MTFIASCIIAMPLWLIALELEKIRKKNKIMTLKEKFENYYDPVYINKEANAHYCEQIADEYAIGFADWILKKYDGIKSAKELLEIYKKEKGL